jgi:phosphatidylethanolamine-binding protein (PEBP) family uncharacterized protein
MSSNPLSQSSSLPSDSSFALLIDDHDGLRMGCFEWLMAAAIVRDVEEFEATRMRGR